MTNKRKFSEGLLDEDTIFKILKINIGQTILDAGCGNGYMAKKFSKLTGKNGKIYALDPDKSMISILQKEVEGSNIIAFTGDITTQTVIKDDSVDLAYLSTVFHIFTKDQTAGFNKEINRILKTNSQLAIINVNKEITSFGPPVEMKSSPEELREKISLSPTKFVKLGEHFYMQIFKKK